MARLNAQRGPSSPTTPRRSDRISKKPINPDYRLRKGPNAKSKLLRPRAAGIAITQQLEALDEEGAAEAGLDDAQVLEPAPLRVVNKGLRRSTDPSSNSRFKHKRRSRTFILNALRSNRQTLVQSLTYLDEDSSRVLQMLAPPDIDLIRFARLMTNLRDRNNPATKRVNNWMSSFHTSIEPFVPTEMQLPYVQIGLVLSALFGDLRELQVGPHRPDDILFKANAASMLVRIVGLQRESEVTRQTLQCLDDNFGDIFFSKVGPDAAKPGNSNLVNKAFNAAIAIRVQLAIVLSQNDELDESRLRELFLHADEQSTTSEPRMRGWEGIDAFEVNDDNYLDSPFKEAAHEFFQELSKASPNDVGSIYKWEDFQFEMASWASSRSSELDSKIEAFGSAGEIQRVLEQKLETPKTSATDGTPGSLTVQDGQRPSVRTSSATNRIKRLGEMARSVTGGSRVITSKHIEGVPKKRSLLDAQPNAQREIFDEGQENESSVEIIEERADTPPAQNSSVEQVVTQDQGFGDLLNSSNELSRANRNEESVRPEGNRNDHANARAGQKRRRQPEEDEQEPKMHKESRRAEQQSSPKRRPRADEENDESYVPENGDVEDEHDSQEEENSEDDGNGNRQNARKHNETPVPIDFVPKRSDFAAVNRAAARVRMVQKERGQARKVWTQMESDALLEYMAKYGLSWQKIKDLDEKGPDILRYRDGVAIKDRARNLKMIYLKSGMRLPPRLDEVALKKKDIANLERCGIDAS